MWGLAVAVKWSSAAPLLVAASMIGSVRGERRLGGVARFVAIAVGAYAVVLLPTVVAFPGSGAAREWCAERCDGSLDERILGTIAHEWHMADAQARLRPDNADPQHAVTWVVQHRPTVLDRDAGGATITAASSPLLWVAGTASIVWVVVGSIRRRRRSAAVITAAVAAAWWLPWVVGDRRAYSFYAAPLVPLLAVSISAVCVDAWRSAMARGTGEPRVIRDQEP
jgi:predicted membrane-bound dolichyl-phosphate-mannose-protein mannosyltransferase